MDVVNFTYAPHQLTNKQGLAEDQRKTILDLANDEAQANEGMPAIFAVCEAVRAWLLDNNVKGLDDGSMHAQMMRKMKEAERSKVCHFTLSLDDGFHVCNEVWIN